MKSVVEEAIDSQARKLNNTIEKLTTDVALLKAENEGLRRTVRIERSRRRREKPLFDDLGVNGEAKGVFFSPNKIQAARDRQIQRIEEKQQAAIQKAEEKEQRELRKLEKQRLIAERKVEREKKKAEREEKAKRKKKLRAKELKQRRLIQEQKLKAKELQKGQKKKSKEVEVQQFTDFVAIEEVERGPSQIRSTRAGRQFKASKRFDD
jgi:Spy/CpxP family protein refolding chaperone